MKASLPVSVSAFAVMAVVGVGGRLARAEVAAGAPSGMALIPAGEFVMGSDDLAAAGNERPAHRVRVEAFYIDRTAVTNSQFRAFVEAAHYVTTAEKPVDWEEMKRQLPPGAPRPAEELLRPGSLVFVPPTHDVDLRDYASWWKWTLGADWRHPQGPGSSIEGKDEHPVVQVSWDDAVAYARWAGKRLPTEAEWEYAARGGLEGKRYAWGDEWMPNGRHMANTYSGRFPLRDTGDDGYVGTSPVRSFPANGYGLYDMAGNVWNWCSDVYDEDAYRRPVSDHRAADHPAATTQGAGVEGCCTTPGGSPADVPRRVDASERVIRGGSFLCSENYCQSYRPSARKGTQPDSALSHVGFRCVKSLQPPG